ncbi:MAG TPA: hypothetical protein VF528_11375 [Pyrinomonadaceae bacterium]|jgi:hypothetical protein
MSFKHIRLFLLIAVLTLTAQPAFTSTIVPGAPSLSPATTTTTRTTPTKSAQQRYRRCRERCYREYRLCTRGVVPPGAARCRARLRNCLRRCYR